MADTTRVLVDRDAARDFRSELRHAAASEDRDLTNSEFMRLLVAVWRQFKSAGLGPVARG